MLNRLTISNFALINNLNLNFNNDFSVITGETGAGKSILLKALNLLLGERADYSVINLANEKCIIEAEFNIENLALSGEFDRWNLDYDPITIIRREILPNGKTRVFVNDTPTTLSTLKTFGSYIIKIHSQHETLDLFNNQFQLETLDSFTKLTDELTTYNALFSNYKSLVKKQSLLVNQVAEQKKARDYNQFLISEFEKINFKNLDIDEILNAAEQFENWENIQTQLNKSYSVLNSKQLSPSQALTQGIDALSKIETISPTYNALLERFKSSKIELDDLESELEGLINNNTLDTEKLTLFQNQAQEINSLLFKHSCGNGKELAAVLLQLETEIHTFSDLETEISELSTQIESDKKKLTKLANELSENRQKCSPNFQQEVETLLSDLGMPNAQLKVKFEKSSELINTGIDIIQYYFKTNLGGEFLPVSKTASGGELARLMLSILYIIAEVKKLPTLIFDEIDTGVSGEIASKMATLFAKMGKHTQLISITHLPQISGKASTHFHVYKTEHENSTITKVKKLSENERVSELAKMMSGERVSEKAIENAKILLKQ